MWLLTLLACALTPPEPLAPLQAEQLATHGSLDTLVQFLADPGLNGREEGSEGSALARAFLVSQLASCGLKPAGTQGFLQPIETGRGTNILASHEGSGEHIIVLSAHYDHQDHALLPHPGAYDNATAVAAVVSVACSLAQEQLEATLLVALWDAEEPPTFLTDQMGSRYWHAHPTLPLAQVSAVIVGDLMGAGLWDGYQGSFALGSETSPELTAAVRNTPVQDGHTVHQAGLHLVEKLVIGPPMVWSDYEVFRSANTPVLFLTDGQNTRYHTPQDTVEHVDFAKLEAESAWLERFTRTVANGPRPRWQPQEQHQADAQVVSRLLAEALKPNHWPPTAREQLQASSAALAQVQAGEAPMDRDAILTMRAGAQRLMCWAGPQASVFRCGLL